MSGFMLCFDLMEMIGEEVEKKREQDTRNYWIRVTSSLRPKITSHHEQVVHTLNEIGDWFAEIAGPDSGGDETVIGLMASMLHSEGDEWEEDNPCVYGYGRWYEDENFWEGNTDTWVTRAFIKGTQYQREQVVDW